MFGLCWCCYHSDDVVPSSTALAFATKMSVKLKSTSPNAVEVKIRCKTFSTEEKLEALSQLQIGE
jgi:hypothetical protein